MQPKVMRLSTGDGDSSRSSRRSRRLPVTTACSATEVDQSTHRTVSPPAAWPYLATKRPAGVVRSAGPTLDRSLLPTPGEESSPGATPISTGLAPSSLPLASNTNNAAAALSITMYGRVPLSCEAAIHSVTRVVAAEDIAPSSDDQPATAGGSTAGGAGGAGRAGAGERDDAGAGASVPARAGGDAAVGVRAGVAVGEGAAVPAPADAGAGAAVGVRDGAGAAARGCAAVPTASVKAAGAARTSA